MRLRCVSPYFVQAWALFSNRSSVTSGCEALKHLGRINSALQVFRYTPVKCRMSDAARMTQRSSRSSGPDLSHCCKASAPTPRSSEYRRSSSSTVIRQKSSIQACRNTVQRCRGEPGCETRSSSAPSCNLTFSLTGRRRLRTMRLRSRSRWRIYGCCEVVAASVTLHARLVIVRCQLRPPSQHAGVEKWGSNRAACSETCILHFISCFRGRDPR